MSLEPRNYSERLGVLDVEQLQSACDLFDLGTVTDAQAPVGGLFGQNVILSTTSGEWVLRGNPHGHVQLTKERVVARFIHERSSLPAPWPYHVSDDTEIFGWTFAVMPCLPGDAGTSLWETEDDRVALASAAGAALVRLHEASSEVFGRYDAQVDDFIVMDDFSDWWMHRFEHSRQLCRDVDALSTEAERYIDDTVEWCADALKEPFEPVIVHHDFTVGNLAFERCADGFAATGVFDLFEAYLSDGEEDVVRMLWTTHTDEQRAAFVDAYTDARALRAGAAERLALYALADWLGIWLYGTRTSSWFEAEAFVDWARPIVERARTVGSKS